MKQFKTPTTEQLIIPTFIIIVISFLILMAQPFGNPERHDIKTTVPHNITTIK